MNSITAVNHSTSTIFGSSGVTREHSPNRGPGFSTLGKAAGVVALLLCGGGDARRTSTRKSSFEGGVPSPAEQHDYKTICDVRLPFAPIVTTGAGMSREDCLAREGSKLKELEADHRKGLRELKYCAIGSGVTAAAFFGLSALSGVVLHDRPMAFGIEGQKVAKYAGLVAFAGMVPTITCAVEHQKLVKFLEASRNEAEQCCGNFPPQKELAA